MPRRRWSGCTAPRILAPSRFSNRLSVSAAYPTSRPASRASQSPASGPSPPRSRQSSRKVSAVWWRSGTAVERGVVDRGQLAGRGEVEVGDRRSARASTVTAPPGAGRPGRGCRGSRRSTPRAVAPRRPRTSSASRVVRLVLGQPAGVPGGEAGLERVPLVQGRLVRGHHREAVRPRPARPARPGTRTRRRARPAVRGRRRRGRRPDALAVDEPAAAWQQSPQRGQRGGVVEGLVPPRPPGPRSGRRRCRSRRRTVPSISASVAGLERHPVREAALDSARRARAGECLLVEIDAQPTSRPGPPRAPGAAARPSRSRRRARSTGRASVRNDTSRPARSSERGARKVRSWWSGVKVGIAASLGVTPLGAVVSRRSRRPPQPPVRWSRDGRERPHGPVQSGYARDPGGCSVRGRGLTRRTPRCYRGRVMTRSLCSFAAAAGPERPVLLAAE